MRIVYCGFDFFSNCLASVAAEHSIVEVFSWRGDGRYNSCVEITQLAENIGCPVYYRRIDESDIARFVDQKVDLLVSAAYPFRIPVGKLEGVHAINVHPSLLPIGRGPWPLPHYFLR